jgi:hypothetical protein
VRHRSVLAATAFMLVMLSSSCDSGCRNTLLQRALSPGGEWEAVAYVRGCGATTRPTANVSLLRAGEPVPDAPGNLVRIDEPAVMAEEPGDIALGWSAPDTLLVRFRANRTAVRKATELQGVTVRYVDR